MWKAVLLVAATAALMLIAVLACWVGQVRPPEMFGAVLGFGLAGFAIAVFAIRVVNRDLL